MPVVETRGTKEKNRKIKKAVRQVHEKQRERMEELQGSLLPSDVALDVVEAIKPLSHREEVAFRLLAQGHTGHAEDKDVDCNVGRSLDVKVEWEDLLSPEFTVADLASVMALHPVSEKQESELSPKQVFALNDKMLKDLFWKRSYEDEATMAMINQAFMLGIEAAQKMRTAGDVADCFDPAYLLEKAQAIIAFLMDGYKDRISVVSSLNVKGLVDKIVAYFSNCDLKGINYTVPGMAFAIGFANRQELVDFVQAKPSTVHAYVIQRAATYIESMRMEDMLKGNGMMVGHKVDMATNFQYHDVSANKKGDSQPQTVINNNMQINTSTMPPKAKDLTEWQQWYIQEKSKKDLDALGEAPLVDVQAQK